MSQWIVFWLLAQSSGVVASGQFAVVVAICTPVFTLVGFGLRNVYITLSDRYAFVNYLALRVCGIVIGAAIVVLTAALVGLPPWLVLVYLVQKCADALLDIFFGFLQKRRALSVFGFLMLLNGLASVLFAGLFAILGGDVVVIVVGAAFGSTLSLVVGCFLIVRVSKRSGSSTRSVLLQRPDWKVCLSVLRRATPVAMWQFLAALNLNIATWAVAIFGSGADVGRFAGAAYLVTAGSLLGAILNSIYIGEYHALVGRDGPRAVVTHARRHVLIVSGFAIVAVAIVVAWGGQFLTLIYGDGFALEHYELLAIGFAAALNPGAQIINAAQLALNRYSSQAKISVLSTSATILVACLGFAGVLDGVQLGCAVALSGSVVTFSLLVLSLAKSRR